MPHSKPYYYFDVIAKKSDEGVTGQSSDYVSLAFDKLIDAGFFRLNEIDELSIWSDGCGKVILFLIYLI